MSGAGHASLTVSDGTPGAAAGRSARAWAAVRRHPWFAAVFTAGLALRVITMLGFPPAIWFGGDSASYLSTALRHVPGTSRLSGYGLMLFLLRPFHSFVVVTGVQHAMGLAAAAMIYTLARRYGARGWAGALAAAPVLLSGYQLQLEQEMLPSAAFSFLVMLAVTLTLWWRSSPPRWAPPAAAAILAVSATFWPTGMPVLILFAGYLLLRWVGWRVLLAAAVAAAVPLACYVLWFHHTYHRYAFNESDGVYLWSRTMSFADCAVIRPPADLRPLCPRRPVGRRPAASTFIWEPDSPLNGLPGKKFSASVNSRALDFALRAIEAQPGAYLGSVLSDAALSFSWDIPPHPSAAMVERYQFGHAATPWIAPAAVVAGDHTVASDQRAYGGDTGTRTVAPFAGFMTGYQRAVYLRGTLLGLVLLLGLGGVIQAWRGGGFRRRAGWGGPGLFPWAVSVTLLLAPVMTADYSLRYTLIAVPAACLAAGLAFTRRGPAGTVPDPRDGHASRRDGAAAGTLTSDDARAAGTA